jgi:hypothetical protein
MPPSPASLDRYASLTGLAMKGRRQGSIPDDGHAPRLVPLPDGRNLDVLVGGADSASALLLINGTPDRSRRSVADIASDVSALMG